MMQFVPRRLFCLSACMHAWVVQSCRPTCGGCSYTAEATDLGGTGDRFWTLCSSLRLNSGRACTAAGKDLVGSLEMLIACLLAD